MCKNIVAWILGGLLVLLHLVLLFPVFRSNPVMFISSLVCTGLMTLMAAERGIHKWRTGAEWKPDWTFRHAHWVQAMGQSTFMTAWGLAFGVVFTRYPLLLQQLILAYTFQILLSLYVGRAVLLNLANFPPILSMSFFIWFRPESYWAQLLMVLFFITAKLTFTRDDSGGRKHIFNPSGIAMAAAAFVLVAHKLLELPFVISFFDTGPTMRLVPYGGLVLLIAGLAPQLVGGTMMITVGCLAAFSSLKLLTPFVVALDTSTFLATVLLVTDPRTSPKRLTAQLVYGACFLFAVLLIERVLMLIPRPLILAKVIALPFLNFTVPAFEKISAPRPLANFAARHQGWVMPATLALYLLLFVFVYPFIGGPTEGVSPVPK